MESEPKRMRTSSEKTIGTHSGTFHCDEALACWMLKQLPEFSTATITRTRDPQILSTLDVLVDVGGEYLPESFRFDHHQRGFTDTFDDKHNIKLSSAGLIYKHFGRQIIARLANTDTTATEILYQHIYDTLIQALDAIDNGISQYSSDVPARYRTSTDLSARVGRLNPAWNESQTDIDERFEKAMKVAGSEFLDALNYTKNSWLPAREIVEHSLKSRYDDFGDANAPIVLLSQFCPWKSHLFHLEKELGIEGQIKYTIYRDTAGSWRVQCVPLAEEGFENRLSLPEPWCGLRDQQLSDLAGIPDCIFVHASGFIGGNQTKEGAISMALQSLKAADAHHHL